MLFQNTCRTLSLPDVVSGKQLGRHWENRPGEQNKVGATKSLNIFVTVISLSRSSNCYWLILVHANIHISCRALFRSYQKPSGAVPDTAWTCLQLHSDCLPLLRTILTPPKILLLNIQKGIKIARKLHAHHHLHNHNCFTAVFLGPTVCAGARRELLDFMVQGKINRSRYIGHLAGRHSIWTNQCPPPLFPHFLQARCPSCRPTNSVKALKATSTIGLGRRC